MKMSTKLAVVMTSAISALAFATQSFAQYACAPACDVPAAPSCAPTCDLPTPTCAPTCDLPLPSCAPACGTLGLGYACNPCGAGFCSVVDVVAAPFKWVACAFTDGIYPDCGCAPRPPKSNCNPCTICGDYVGGCNDRNYNSCAPCDYGAPVYQNEIGAIPQGAEYYDAEAYDASPTSVSKAHRFSSNSLNPRVAAPQRQTVAPQNLDVMVAQRLVPNRNASTLNAASRNVETVRSVNYEQARAKVAAERVVSAPNPQIMQNKENVRIVDANRAQAPAAVGKTFGTTRPIK